MADVFRSLTYTIPAPLGGWNARDPLDNMPENDAVVLDNLFPDTSEVKLRKGFTSYATGMGSGSVRTLAEIVGNSGTRKLVAAANNKFYNISSSGAAVDITGTTTPTNNQWKYVIYKYIGIFVNGVDQPQQINSTPTVSDASYTGIADDSKLVDVTVYRDRLYFAEIDSLSIWYGSVNSLTGALTEFDLERIFSKGGYIQFIGTWARETGSGMDDLFVVVTNMGEVAVYTGANPGDATWSLLGRYDLPIPLGRRAGFNLGSDFIIITEQGAIPLSSVVFSGKIGSYTSVTDKIQDAFRKTALTAKNNFGYEALIFPAGNHLIINIPRSEDVEAYQYVMNTLTGAWCRYKGIDAGTWCLYNEEPYFGGFDGTVYKFNDGQDDNGVNIDYVVKHAFNYLGNQAQNKQWVMSQPIIKASQQINLGIDVDIDFETRPIGALATTTGAGTGSSWDIAEWDVAEWDSDLTFNTDWFGLCGIGRAGALRIAGTAQGVNLSYLSNRVIYQPGGYL